MIFVGGPILILFPASLVLGFILLVLGLMRLRGGWKKAMPMIAGALLLQSWWIVIYLWITLKPNIGLYQDYGIKAETPQ
ncbi:MAG: hypothetical protein QM758_25295 [Armatimonas sp.]